MKNTYKILFAFLAAITLSFASGGSTILAATTGAEDLLANDKPLIKKDKQATQITGQYIVTLKDAKDTPSKKAEEFSTKFGAKVKFVYSTALHGFSINATDDQIAKIKQQPEVASVSPDYMVSIDNTQASPDWGLDRMDQRSANLDSSYTYNSDGTGVTSYVIDTGLRISHQEFQGRASYGYDFIDNDAIADDCHGHGTHVAGTIGGQTYGVAKNVNVVGVRVLDCQGSGSTSQVIAGIDWVTANANGPSVVNMSLGGTASNEMDTAIRNSIASGITYAIAAGNSDDNCNKYSPSRVTEAIVVGASAQNDARADFSNFGPCVDIFAPGVNITSAWKDSDAATYTSSGTSMAAPHVAGAAALILSQNPSYAPAQVASTMIANSSINMVTNYDSATTLSANRLLYVGDPAAPQITDGACMTAVDTGSIRIPGPGYVYSDLNFSGCNGQAARFATITVNATLTYRPFTIVELVSPAGETISLSGIETRTGYTAYTPTSYYVNLSDKQRSGVWRLYVKNYWFSAGKFTSASVKL